MKLLTITWVLFAGMAFGQSNAGQDTSEERIIRRAIHEQGFEQLLASHVSQAEQLPPSGILEGADSIPGLTHPPKPRAVFKLGTWVLCVAPKPSEDGTVLVVDSIQTHPRDKGRGTVEVLYRRVKTPGRHTANQVWPYALLFVKGLHDEAICRSANG